MRREVVIPQMVRTQEAMKKAELDKLEDVGKVDAGVWSVIVTILEQSALCKYRLVSQCQAKRCSWQHVY